MSDYGDEYEMEDTQDIEYSYEDYGDEDDGPEESGVREDLPHISTGGAAIKGDDSGFKVLANNEVYRMLTGVINDVSSLLDVDSNMAQSLLQYYNWDKEKVVELYFNRPGKMLAEAGMDLYDAKQPLGNFCGDCSFNCRICFEEHDAGEMSFSLWCGHKFCREMFCEYLKNQVNTEGLQSIKAHCPEHKCKQLVTPEIFYIMLGAQERAKYERYVTNFYVESNKSMKHCPAANCEKVILSSDDSVSAVTCTCNYSFCFKCSEEVHTPCSCEQLVKWNEKCMSDGESAKWIFSNTKKCPNCHSRIEKNQGCNHMVCGNCRHNFCWLCLGTKCGHFQCVGKLTTDNKEAASQAKAKAELDRYLHYYKRYQEHANAIKLASQQRLEAEKKMEDAYQNKAMSWIDVQFIKEAVEQVISSRQILKYTYIIGYFMRDKAAERLLFERHQEMLEEQVQKLHEYIYLKNSKDMDRTQVINWTRITEKFRTSMLEYFGEEAIVDKVGSVYQEDNEVLEEVKKVFHSNAKEGMKVAKKK